MEIDVDMHESILLIGQLIERFRNPAFYEFDSWKALERTTRHFNRSIGKTTGTGRIIIDRCWWAQALERVNAKMALTVKIRILPATFQAQNP